MKLADGYLNSAEAGTATSFRVNLSGTGAVAGDVVELLLNGAAFGTAKTATLVSTNISNGYVDFSVASVEFGADGAKSLTARLTDQAGNISNASAARLFTLDTVAPTPPSVALAADTGISGSDRLTNNASINVGNLESGATWQYSTDSGTSWTSGTGTSFTVAAEIGRAHV